MQQMNKKFAAKAQKLEVEEHKLQILKERMGHSKLGQLQNRQAELEAKVQQAESELKTAKAMVEESRRKLMSLEMKLKNLMQCGKRK